MKHIQTAEMGGGGNALHFREYLSQGRRTAKKRARKDKPKGFDGELASTCERLLGERVTAMQYPGGATRRSRRLMLQHRDPVIVSIRKNRRRTATECRVLEALSARGAPVPRLLAKDGRKMLIQEHIPGERLAQAMHGRGEARVEQVLHAALDSLCVIQRAGSHAGLDTDLAVLGQDFHWLVNLLERPAVIGNFFGIPAPRLRLKYLKSLLAVRWPRFVKWDSRPGNAILRIDDQVYWFDWEHCGARNRLDDMAWLLTDEYVPDYPAAEQRLIDKHIASFADDLSVAEARQYLSVYGVFHLSVRLGLICKYKARGGWWDTECCLQEDKVGVTRESLLRVCGCGARWAKRHPYTEALSPWFLAMAARFEAESCEESEHLC